MNGDHGHPDLHFEFASDYEREDLTLRDIRMLPWLAVCAAMFLTEPALAATDCEFKSGKAFSVKGAVVQVGAASELVAELGYTMVVAIHDRNRDCIAYVQTHRAPGCSKGKTATARGTTFVVPFTPVALPGGDNVKCR